MSGPLTPVEPDRAVTLLPIPLGSEGAAPARSALSVGDVLTGPLGLLNPEGGPFDSTSLERAEVLVFAILGNSCPAVKACTQSLVEFQERLGPRGVQVVAVNSNNEYLSPRDAPKEMPAWAQEQGLNFPYLKDPNGTLARRLGATNTPHFLVLDGERRLRYRGRMFDSREPARATAKELEAAVEAVMAHRDVPAPETNPLGCSIVW